MKKLYIILLALFLFCSTVSASDSLRSRKSSLLYSISSLFTDNEFSQLFGYQFITGSNSAVRVIAGFGYYDFTTKKPENTEQDLTSDSLDILFNPCFIYYLSQNSSVKPYTGFGFLLYSINSNLKGIDHKSLERKISKLAIGANILLGAEWFPTDNFSVGIEYELLIKFISGDITHKSGGNEQTDTLPNETKILIKPSSLGLYLSYYFD